MIVGNKRKKALSVCSGAYRYVLNYSPFDITYKLCKFLPFKVVIYCMKEIQRASKVLHGVHFAMKIYPTEWVIICVVGILKGMGLSIVCESTCGRIVHACKRVMGLGPCSSTF